MEEVLYKIFDLTNGECTDVKRGELLDGKGGCYYLDYRYLAPSQWMKVAPNSAPPYRSPYLPYRVLIFISG